MSEDATDLRLKALLASPERAPDEGFALGVTRVVLVEERLRASRRTAWRRFAVEMVAAAAAIGAFWLLARATPPDSDRIVPLFSPASAGLMLLALWVLVSLRPAAGRPNPF